MIDALDHIDRWLFLCINGSYAKWIDGVMIFFSWKYTFVIYLPVLAYGWFKVGQRKAGFALLAMLLSFALADSISSRIFKPTFERFRPCHNPEIQSLVRVVDHCGGSYGFVSSHAANHAALAFCIFTYLGMFEPRYRKWVFGLPILIAYSRVYLGVHYPGDVLIGGLLGLAIAWGVCKLLGKWW
ncbi:MAG TPA: phosphatase PAP2 family protein [Luteibaculaceae bacterium]|nr:phosphatase PAP2 family protein [Luteibaculaceae bacterium]